MNEKWGWDRLGTILAIVLLLGFALHLRHFHVDYPAIGYHNMKETEWLSVTAQFYEDGPSVHRIVHAQADAKDPPYWENPQLAVISFIGWLQWQVTGPSVGALRYQMIAFSVGTVLLIFLVFRRMGLEQPFSLLVALVFAMLPLNIYFGRHISEAAPGNFFLLLFFWLFLRWRDTRRARDAALCGLSWVVLGTVKLPFLLPTVAVLALTPWRDFWPLNRTVLRQVWGFSTAFLILGFFALLQATNHYYDWRGPLTHTIDPWVWTTAEFRAHPLWENFWANNWTEIGGTAGILGLFVALADRRLRWFVLIYTAMLMPYLALFSDQVKGHNYYQAPFSLLMAVGISAAIFLPLKAVAERFRQPEVVWAAICVPFFAITDIQAQIDLMFNTQFYGQDVAARYIKKVEPDGGRMLVQAGSQSRAVCYYANQLCMVVPDDVKRLEEYETRFDSRFMYVTARNIRHLRSTTPTWRHVAANYGLVEFGYLKLGNREAPQYFLLQRGLGPLDVNAWKQWKPKWARVYETSRGKFPAYVRRLPARKARSVASR